MRRQEEFRNSQNKEGGGPQSEPESSDEFDEDNFDEEIAPLQHASTFPMTTTGPPPGVAPYIPRYDNPATASMESLQRTIVAAQAAHHSAPAELNHNFFESSGHANNFPTTPNDFTTTNAMSFPSRNGSTSSFDTHRNFSYPNLHSQHYIPSHHMPEVQEASPPSYDVVSSSMPTYGSENAVHVSHIVTAFPSQLVSKVSEQVSQQPGDNTLNANAEYLRQNSTTPIIQYDLESGDQSTALPTPSLPRAPPSAGIASRRPKVHNKPAMLGLDMTKGRPGLGPRTVSHAEGFRRPLDSPMGSPMRRIVSAGGNRPGMSSRVHKSGVESAQRSPINFGNFADAGAFFEHNSHNIRNPPLLSANNLAPPTPLSPKDRYLGYMPKEEGSSHNSPVNGVSYIGHESNYVTTAMQSCPQDQMINQEFTSPPVTPENALGLAIPPKVEWNTTTFQENDWYGVPDVPDVPLFTPAQESFNLEIQMPQPAYIHSLSTPVTPAIYQYPPNVFLNHDSSPLEGEGGMYSHSYPTQLEYNFPEAHGQYYVSPASKQKTFQFSHTTPADFVEK